MTYSAEGRTRKHKTVKDETFGTNLKRKIILIGCSAGGQESLDRLLGYMEDKFPPMIIAAHFANQNNDRDVCYRLKSGRIIKAERPEEDSCPDINRIYYAPSNKNLGLSIERKFVYRELFKKQVLRPLIDAVFISFARVYKQDTIGIILSGMLDDGAQGIKAIRDCGGHCFIQDPNDAPQPSMPNAAIDLIGEGFVYSLREMAEEIALRLRYKHVPLTRCIPIPQISP